MAEPQIVIFEDQEHRRRKLQLHAVDGALRVNLGTALANYEAVSFSRAADGLILELYKDTAYSTQTFKAGEVVSIEAVRRNADNSQAILKALSEELDRRGLVAGLSVDAIVRGVTAELSQGQLAHLLRNPYQDVGAAQPMQQDSPHAMAQHVDVGQHQVDGVQPHPQSAAAQMGVGVPMVGMQTMMTPGAASPATSELNASGKKRRFCGACANHDVKTPVTFQHQQQCQWRNCPCSLCVKKRAISQAQARKRHLAKEQQVAATSSHVQVDSMPQEMQHQQSAPPSPGQLAVPVPEQEPQQ